MKFLRTNWLKIIIVLAVLLGGYYFYHQKKLAASSATTFIAGKDQIVTPKRGDIKDQISLAGSISASGVANLRFQNSGKLVWVGVKVGDKVKKWQAIAGLDQKELKKNLQTQFNNYRTEFSQFWDVQKQYKDIVISDTIQRILDRTQYSLDNSVIDYEITDMSIKESTLVSPIAGVVVSVDQPVAGANITPATATFTVVNPDSVYFKAEIDQVAVTQIKSGQTAIITLDSFPDQPMASKVTYIAFTPVVGQSSTVYEIRFELPVNNSDLSYRLGMNGDVNILAKESPDALIIPTDAVYNDNGQSYVWLKNGNQLVRQNLTIGIETDTDTEVLTGLTGNETLVIKTR